MINQSLISGAIMPENYQNYTSFFNGNSGSTFHHDSHLDFQFGLKCEKNVESTFFTFH